MENYANFEQVISEHKQLKSLFSRIQKEFDQPIVCTRRLYAMLTEALVEISAHFQREEHNGFFEQIVAHKPCLRPQTEVLINQHVEFRQRLTEIASQLAQSTEDTLFDLSREFDSFLTEYFKHEGRENQLARQVFDGEPHVD